LILISPGTLRFRGKEGSVLTQTVEILAQEEKPLNIKAGEFTLKDKMAFRLEETVKGKAFKLYFTNVPLPAGQFSGTLKLMTNYKDKPEITVSISGDFQKETEENEKR
jgi:hypothetical protein